ncbi:MAG: DUF1287 domain-containing protein [Moheibacter sp.]
MKFSVAFVLLFIMISCKKEIDIVAYSDNQIEGSTSIAPEKTNLTNAQQKISDAALSIVDPNIIYDPTYFSIDYPNGDVPTSKGVCTDVVIRTYRKLGIDLQKEVHEDMKRNFSLYPKIWGLTKTDTNIDHRRVPNLMFFFSRFGEEKSMEIVAEDYLPGDIVCWRLSNGMTHIGVVVDRKSSDNERFKIVHNIGGGQVLEDVLFNYKIIGHYFYAPNSIND